MYALIGCGYDKFGMLVLSVDGRVSLVLHELICRTKNVQRTTISVVPFLTSALAKLSGLSGLCTALSWTTEGIDRASYQVEREFKGRFNHIPNSLLLPTS